MLKPCYLVTPGLVPYGTALQWQRSLVTLQRQQPDRSDVLLLLEHPPVYTLGQGSNVAFLKFDPAQAEFDTVQTERGGEVTYHCPGQLVGYPILNLHRYQCDLHWYLRQLEEVLIQVLKTYGLDGQRIPGLTGVWLDGQKVAAIGIKVSRWITMHGFALNVCPELEGFGRIVPCGIPDKPVGRLVDFMPALTLPQVTTQVALAFSEVFQVRLQVAPITDVLIPSLPS